MKPSFILSAVGAAVVVTGCDKPPSVYAEAPTGGRAVSAAGAAPGYIGVWAASAQACATQAWTFTEARVEAPGGASCAIVGAEATTAGYSASSFCTAPGQAEPKSGRIILTLMGPAPGDSLTVTGADLAQPVSLVRCPV